MTNTNDFDTALAAFVSHCQAVVTKNHTDNKFTFKCSTITVEKGKKFARIVRNDGSSRSCHCFVDMLTGDILKTASWKAPAKGVRGSIYSKVDCVSPYGCFYLR